ncbi:MAG: hypothetical protein V7K32_16550 [Nostoc sp.]
MPDEFKHYFGNVILITARDAIAQQANAVLRKNLLKAFVLFMKYQASI